MLTKEEYTMALEALAEMEFIKSHTKISATDFSFEMYTNVQEKSHTQVVLVTLVNETHVLAFSAIGPCPNNAEQLQSILAENMDGCYTRLAAFEGDLVQVYRYPLEFLEPWEMFKALDELSQLANYARQQYF